jgi:adenylate kinase
MRILFLGAPGAGKGTQCKKLAEKFSLPHLSSGDLLREAVGKGTKAGLEAKDFMDRGVLVPDPVLIAMFRDKLTSAECAKGFILDGFPRNLAQAQALASMLADINANLSWVINLITDDAVLTERITGRRICSNKSCNAVYHIKFSAPKTDNKCDKCGSDLYQRSDDKEELVKKRLFEYRSQTEPLIDYYGDKKLLCSVDGEGDQEKIFADILQCIKVPA